VFLRVLYGIFGAICAVCFLKVMGVALVFTAVAHLTRCAVECAVRFEPMRANTGFFATSTKCFRAG
jgi:hypothetical protein